MQISKEKIVALLALVLAAGLALGWYLGRARLEREWSNPIVLMPGDLRFASAAITPPPGTRVLRPLPLRRARAAAAEFTRGDLVTAKVVSFGNDERGVELHVVVANHAGCTLSTVRGVAYAYDAHGKAVLGESGVSFVGFSSENLSIAKDTETTSVAVGLPPFGNASIGFAHIDGWTCKEGPSWHRAAS